MEATETNKVVCNYVALKILEQPLMLSRVLSTHYLVLSLVTIYGF